MFAAVFPHLIFSVALPPVSVKTFAVPPGIVWARNELSTPAVIVLMSAKAVGVTRVVTVLVCFVPVKSRGVFGKLTPLIDSDVVTGIVVVKSPAPLNDAILPRFVHLGCVPVAALLLK